jgi:hypothetical protein
MPYDFDMSGVVDAPYAVVSEINGIQVANRKCKRTFVQGILQITRTN